MDRSKIVTLYTLRQQLEGITIVALNMQSLWFQQDPARKSTLKILSTLSILFYMDVFIFIGPFSTNLGQQPDLASRNMPQS